MTTLGTTKECNKKYIEPTVGLPFLPLIQKGKDKATRLGGPLTYEVSLFNHQGRDDANRVRMEQ